MWTLKGIGVRPPEDLAVTQKSVAGMKFMDIKSGLTELVVLCHGDLKTAAGEILHVRPNDLIYVSKEAIAAARWAREVFEQGGLKFVVVPADMVVGHAHPEHV